MGGTKCTYRSCTSRSDGKTHMFHYPVFDKIRCHKWLTNAQRLDFLNLKVSQVKNRVVCQHHFQPDNFMNYRMDKLRYDAVPTENGPFCIVNDLVDRVRTMPIGADEIENDQLTLKEKQANFSVKYGDFLINSEMDHEKLDLINKQKQTLNTLRNSHTREVNVEFEDTAFKNTAPPKDKKICIISEKKISAPLKVEGKLEPVPKNLIICPRNVQKTVDNIENMNVVFHNPNENVDLSHSEITFYTQPFTEPQLLQIDQSGISLPAVNQNFEPNRQLVNIEVVMPEVLNSNPQMLQATSDSNNKLPEISPLKTKTNQISPQSHQSSNSVLKNKIPPERVAAIEKKRVFNKKLRDMIEFCLDDSPEKTAKENSKKKEMKNKESVTALDNKKSTQHSEKQAVSLKDNKNECSKQKVSVFLSEEPSLPSISEYNMAALETRLKRMEENLMHKIEENSRKIGDLKSTLQPTLPILSKRKQSVMTQTKEDEDSFKKQLFQEISQFLSPDANSLIYEELFLEKYSKKSSLKSEDYVIPVKRRKLS